jgi:adenylate cyclase
MTHGHHTFLFADLAGFTAMTEAHGDEMAADAASDFGDAVMVRVTEACAAVDLAVRLMRELGAQHGALAVRVGVHTGPAVHRDGDWFGATVNLAARVAAAAKSGEILLTEPTYGAAAPALHGLRLERRPGQRFKNIAEPVTVYALTVTSQPNLAELPTDPVCRMVVDPDVSHARRVVGDVELFFCSPECLASFERAPDRYTGG